jgi:hydrogenase expression/formation protein HypC
MCLGIPGRIVAVSDPPDQPDLRTGTVDFDGVRRQVCLAYTPEADVDDYVVVRAIPGALDTELGSAS